MMMTMMMMGDDDDDKNHDDDDNDKSDSGREQFANYSGVGFVPNHSLSEC